jgi:predicted sulfurtransferase
MSAKTIQIITFYEFKPLENLPELRENLIAAMRENSIMGTIILAEEGFNSTLSGAPDDVENFVRKFEEVWRRSLNTNRRFTKKTRFVEFLSRSSPKS